MNWFRAIYRDEQGRLKARQIPPWMEWVVRIIFVLVLLALLYTTLKNDSRLATDRQYLIDNCQRFELQLAGDNRSHFDDYDFFHQVYAASADAQATNAAILRRFHVVLPAKVKQDQADEIARLKADVQRKTWTPLENCVHIINTRGFHYRPPPSVRFVDRLPSVEDLHYYRK